MLVCDRRTVCQDTLLVTAHGTRCKWQHCRACHAADHPHLSPGLLSTEDMTWVSVSQSVHQQSAGSPINRASGHVPTPRSAHGQSMIDDRYIIVMGGWDGRVELDDVHVFDTATKLWHHMPTQGTRPPRRHFHTFIVVNGWGMLIGGYDGDVWMDDVWGLNLQTWTWHEFSHKAGKPWPARRASAAGVALHDRIVMFGGYDGQSFLSDLWTLHVPSSEDITSLRWELHQPAGAGAWPPGRSGHAMTNLGPLLIVSSGRFHHGRYNDTWVLNADTMQWHQPSILGALPQPRKTHALARWGLKLWIIGGHAGEEWLNDMHSLDFGPVLAELARAGVPQPADTLASDMLTAACGDSAAELAAQAVVPPGDDGASSAGAKLSAMFAAQAADLAESEADVASEQHQPGHGARGGSASSAHSLYAAQPTAAALRAAFYTALEHARVAGLGDAAAAFVADTALLIKAGFGSSPTLKRLLQSSPVRQRQVERLLHLQSPGMMPGMSPAAQDVTANDSSTGAALPGMPSAHHEAQCSSPNVAVVQGGEALPSMDTSPSAAAPAGALQGSASGASLPCMTLPAARTASASGASCSSTNGSAVSQACAPRDAAAPDVQVLVGTEAQWNLHAFVLTARSKYFRAALSARWQPQMPVGEVRRCQVPDMSPAVFQAVAVWMYTDLLPPPWTDTDQLVGILAAADLLGCAQLRDSTQRMLSQCLSERTAPAILRAVDQHNAPALRASTVEFILQHFDAVSRTANFLELPQPIIFELLLRRAQPAVSDADVVAATEQRFTLPALPSSVLQAAAGALSQAPSSLPRPGMKRPASTDLLGGARSSPGAQQVATAMARRESGCAARIAEPALADHAEPGADSPIEPAPSS